MIGIGTASVGFDASSILSWVGLAVVTGIVGFVLPRALRRYGARGRGFRILIDDEKIISRRPGVPDVVIPCSEITQVREDPQRGLSVRGSSNGSLIRVPIYMIGYSELRDLVPQPRRIES